METRVFNGCPGDRVVGNDQTSVVGRVQSCREQVDFIDLAGDSCHGHNIAHLEWTKDDHQDTGREVAERSLECHSDRETRRCDHCGQAAEFGAESACHRCDEAGP